MPFLPHILPSLPVVMPLGMAALLAGIGAFFPRRVFDTLAILTALATLAACLLLIAGSLQGPIVYWFGDWKPTPEGFPLGISFVIDPLAAGTASLVSLLSLLSLVFSWGYFKSIQSLYHALMLVFLAAMNGLCLTGDLFNLFVWFELMTAAAVALCGYKAEETGPLQGALNFAVSNTVGAFLSLSGIAFLYAFTGTLNIAEIGRSLAQHSPGDAFLAVAFLLVVTGFLVKSAVAPFHFWLADAHAVAPTPVCMLFSGIMVELGLYAVVRLYFGIFAPSAASPGGHQDAYRTLLLAIGVLTAVIGALECFGQHHLKRLLAFSTISHAGLILIGIALLDAGGLDGAFIYLLGHGLVKAALFICAGILLNRFDAIDEFDLYGKGKSAKGTGLMMFIGALGLLALPPFGTFFGHDHIDHAAEQLGFGWTAWLFIFVAALTSAAVMRFAVRCFLGLGSHQRSGNQDSRTPEERETNNPPDRTPATMWIPAAVALILAVVLPSFPHFRETTARFSQALISSHVYADAVLAAAPIALPDPPPEPQLTYWPSLLSLAIALLLAGVTLFSDHIPGFPTFSTLIARLWDPVHKLQSGRITDYIAWLTLGVAAWSVLLLFLQLH